MITNKTTDAINALLANAPQIPGLDFDTIANAFIKNKYPESEKMSKGDKDSFYVKTKAMLKPKFDIYISHIKQLYQAIKDGLVNVADSIEQIAISLINPSVISAPVSVPNPVAVNGDIVTKKNVLKTTLALLSQFFLSMIDYAIQMDYELPDQILSLVQKIVSTKSAVDNIPTL